MSISSTLSETNLITGENLLAMGDIGPCELIDGRIVAMTPTGAKHAMVEMNLTRYIGNFVANGKLGWVMCGEVGIYTRRSPDRIRAADIAFISKERLLEGPPRGFLEVAPELVVEIISPGDRWQDVRQKLEEYFSIGVQWVWIVEPEQRVVLVYRSSTQIDKFTSGDTVLGEGVLEGFNMPVDNLFEI